MHFSFPLTNTLMQHHYLLISSDVASLTAVHTYYLVMVFRVTQNNFQNSFLAHCGSLTQHQSIADVVVQRSPNQSCKRLAKVFLA